MRFSFAFTVVAIQFLVPNLLDRGIIASSYPIMEMVSGFFIGIITDKIGRKWIIVNALFFSSLVTLSFAFTLSPILLTIIHGLQGVCAAAIITGSLALLTDIGKSATRGRQMGLYDFVTISGYAIGFVFALVLIQGEASRTSLLFFSGATAAFLSGIISAVVLKESKTDEPTSVSLKENIGKVAKSKSALTLIPAWFVLMMTIGVFLTYTRDIFSILLPNSNILFLGSSSSSQSGVGIGVAGIVIVVVGAILLGFTQTSFGNLSDRFGRRRVALIGQVSIAGLLSILVGLFTFNLNRSLAFGLLLLFGAGLLAFTPAALAELAEAAPVKARGSTMGLYTLTIGAGTAFGPLAAGELINRFGLHLGLSLYFSLGILIMVIALVPRLLRI